MNEQNFGTNPVEANETKNHDFIKEENKIVKPEVSHLESDNRILMEDSGRLEPEEDSVRSEETMNLNDTNSPQRGYSILGSRQSPIPLKQSAIYEMENHSCTYKLELTVLGYTRGMLSECELEALGIYRPIMDFDMEFLIIQAEVKALESVDDRKISIEDSDFELVSEIGVKYEGISIRGNVPKLQDMYKGAIQSGFVFFKVRKTDMNPSVVFKETYSNPGLWFSLNEEQ